MSNGLAAWQKSLQRANEDLYAAGAPPQVSAAFVLQYLLQVPAHTAAFGALSGPWLVALDALGFDLAPWGSAREVRIGAVRGDMRNPRERLTAAHAAYVEMAEPVAHSYPAGVPFGSRQRSAMVSDVWRLAERDARRAFGLAAEAVVEREGCCFIYALPGCHECEGCPRLRRR